LIQCSLASPSVCSALLGSVPVGLQAAAIAVAGGGSFGLAIVPTL
jgi:hypothetical protein